MAIKKIITIQISAESTEEIDKMTSVLRNVAEKVSPRAFCNVLYPKILNNPDFFKSVVNNPMLKLFK
jgi:hypothetical protein